MHFKWSLCCVLISICPASLQGNCESEHLAPQLWYRASLLPAPPPSLSTHVFPSTDIRKPAAGELTASTVHFILEGVSKRIYKAKGNNVQVVGMLEMNQKPGTHQPVAESKGSSLLGNQAMSSSLKKSTTDVFPVLFPWKRPRTLGLAVMVVHTFNPSTQRAETGKSL